MKESKAIHEVKTFTTQPIEAYELLSDIFLSLEHSYTDIYFKYSLTHTLEEIGGKMSHRGTSNCHMSNLLKENYACKAKWGRQDRQ